MIRPRMYQHSKRSSAPSILLINSNKKCILLTSCLSFYYCYCPNFRLLSHNIRTTNSNGIRRVNIKNNYVNRSSHLKEQKASFAHLYSFYGKSIDSTTSISGSCSLSSGLRTFSTSRFSPSASSHSEMRREGESSAAAESTASSSNSLKKKQENLSQYKQEFSNNTSRNSANLNVRFASEVMCEDEPRQVAGGDSSYGFNNIVQSRGSNTPYTNIISSSHFGADEKSEENTLAKREEFKLRKNGEKTDLNGFIKTPLRPNLGISREQTHESGYVPHDILPFEFRRLFSNTKDQITQANSAESKNNNVNNNNNNNNSNNNNSENILKDLGCSSDSVSGSLSTARVVPQLRFASCHSFFKSKKRFQEQYESKHGGNTEVPRTNNNSISDYTNINADENNQSSQELEAMAEIGSNTCCGPPSCPNSCFVPQFEFSEELFRFAKTTKRPIVLRVFTGKRPSGGVEVRPGEGTGVAGGNNVPTDALARDDGTSDSVREISDKIKLNIDNINPILSLKSLKKSERKIKSFQDLLDSSVCTASIYADDFGPTSEGLLTNISHKTPEKQNANNKINFNNGNEESSYSDHEETIKNEAENEDINGVFNKNYLFNSSSLRSFNNTSEKLKVQQDEKNKGKRNFFPFVCAQVLPNNELIIYLINLIKEYHICSPSEFDKIIAGICTQSRAGTDDEFSLQHSSCLSASSISENTSYNKNNSVNNNNNTENNNNSNNYNNNNKLALKQNSQKNTEIIRAVMTPEGFFSSIWFTPHFSTTHLRDLLYESYIDNDISVTDSTYNYEQDDINKKVTPKQQQQKTKDDSNSKSSATFSNQENNHCFDKNLLPFFDDNDVLTEIYLRTTGCWNGFSIVPLKKYKAFALNCINRFANNNCFSISNNAISTDYEKKEKEEELRSSEAPAEALVAKDMTGTSQFFEWLHGFNTVEPAGVFSTDAAGAGTERNDNVWYAKCFDNEKANENGVFFEAFTENTNKAECPEKKSNNSTCSAEVYDENIEDGYAFLFPKYSLCDVRNKVREDAWQCIRGTAGSMSIGRLCRTVVRPNGKAYYGCVAEEIAKTIVKALMVCKTGGVAGGDWTTEPDAHSLGGGGGGGAGSSIMQLTNSLREKLALSAINAVSNSVGTAENNFTNCEMKTNKHICEKHGEENPDLSSSNNESVISASSLSTFSAPSHHGLDSQLTPYVSSDTSLTRVADALVLSMLSTLTSPFYYSTILPQGINNTKSSMARTASLVVGAGKNVLYNALLQAFYEYRCSKEQLKKEEEKFGFKINNNDSNNNRCHTGKNEYVKDNSNFFKGKKRYEAITRLAKISTTMAATLVLRDLCSAAASSSFQDFSNHDIRENDINRHTASERPSINSSVINLSEKLRIERTNKKKKNNIKKIENSASMKKKIQKRLQNSNKISQELIKNGPHLFNNNKSSKDGGTSSFLHESRLPFIFDKKKMHLHVSAPKWVGMEEEGKFELVFKVYGPESSNRLEKMKRKINVNEKNKKESENLKKNNEEGKGKISSVNLESTRDNTNDMNNNKKVKNDFVTSALVKDTFNVAIQLAADVTEAFFTFNNNSNNNKLNNINNSKNNNSISSDDQARVENLLLFLGASSCDFEVESISVHVSLSLLETLAALSALFRYIYSIISPSNKKERNPHKLVHKNIVNNSDDSGFNFRPAAFLPLKGAAKSSVSSRSSDFFSTIDRSADSVNSFTENVQKNDAKQKNENNNNNNNNNNVFFKKKSKRIENIKGVCVNDCDGNEYDKAEYNNNSKIDNKNLDCSYSNYFQEISEQLSDSRYPSPLAALLHTFSDINLKKNLGDIFNDNNNCYYYNDNSNDNGDNDNNRCKDIKSTDVKGRDSPLNKAEICSFFNNKTAEFVIINRIKDLFLQALTAVDTTASVILRYASCLVISKAELSINTRGNHYSNINNNIDIMHPFHAGELLYYDRLWKLWNNAASVKAEISSNNNSTSCSLFTPRSAPHPTPVHPHRCPYYLPAVDSLALQHISTNTIESRFAAEASIKTTIFHELTGNLASSERLLVATEEQSSIFAHCGFSFEENNLRESCESFPEKSIAKNSKKTGNMRKSEQKNSNNTDNETKDAGENEKSMLVSVSEDEHVKSSSISDYCASFDLNGKGNSVGGAEDARVVNGGGADIPKADWMENNIKDHQCQGKRFEFKDEQKTIQAVLVNKSKPNSCENPDPEFVTQNGGFPSQSEASSDTSTTVCVSSFSSTREPGSVCDSALEASELISSPATAVPEPSPPVSLPSSAPPPAGDGEEETQQEDLFNEEVNYIVADIMCRSKKNPLIKRITQNPVNIAHLWGSNFPTDCSTAALTTLRLSAATSARGALTASCVTSTPEALLTDTDTSYFSSNSIFSSSSGSLAENDRWARPSAIVDIGLVAESRAALRVAHNLHTRTFASLSHRDMSSIATGLPSLRSSRFPTAETARMWDDVARSAVLVNTTGEASLGVVVLRAGVAPSRRDGVRSRSKCTNEHNIKHEQCQKENKKKEKKNKENKSEHTGIVLREFSNKTQTKHVNNNKIYTDHSSALCCDKKSSFSYKNCNDGTNNISVSDNNGFVIDHVKRHPSIIEEPLSSSSLLTAASLVGGCVRTCFIPVALYLDFSSATTEHFKVWHDLLNECQYETRSGFRGQRIVEIQALLKSVCAGALDAEKEGGKKQAAATNRKTTAVAHDDYNKQDEADRESGEEEVEGCAGNAYNALDTSMDGEDEHDKFANTDWGARILQKNLPVNQECPKKEGNRARKEPLGLFDALSSRAPVYIGDPSGLLLRIADSLRPFLFDPQGESNVVYDGGDNNNDNNNRDINSASEPSGNDAVNGYFSSAPSSSAASFGKRFRPLAFHEEGLLPFCCARARKGIVAPPMAYLLRWIITQANEAVERKNKSKFEHIRKDEVNASYSYGETNTKASANENNKLKSKKLKFKNKKKILPNKIKQKKIDNNTENVDNSDIIMKSTSSSNNNNNSCIQFDVKNDKDEWNEIGVVFKGRLLHPIVVSDYNSMAFITMI